MASRPHFFTPQAPGPPGTTNWQAGPGPGGGFDEFAPQAGPSQRPPQGDPANPLNDILYGAGSGFIRSGLGAYGERMFGSGRDFVQANVNRYFSSQDVYYYFQVNNQYVKNKLKILLFPFLHRGHWTRIAEQVAGGLTYKPPRGDINAPDLYIPFMAYMTYIVLGGLAMGLDGRFNPSVMNARFTKGLIGWFLEVVLLRSLLYTLGSSDAPILDLVAYSGYMFVGISVSILAWTIWHYSYYGVIIWTSLCTGIFLVKTMKRVLFSETRSYSQETSVHHYSLILMALAQFPLALWLGIL